MATRAKKDPQGGFQDRDVEDSEFEQLLEEALEHDEEYDQKRKRIFKLRKQIADKAEHYQLAEGQRLRVGEFIVTGKKRAGGGFEIPAWEKVTVGSIKRADDPA